MRRALESDADTRWEVEHVLTGSGSEHAAVEAMKSGAQDSLVKEALTPERLLHSLRMALETVRLARELVERRLQTERAAREALAMRDELYALATHDLKGPLLRRQLSTEALSSTAEARLAYITCAAGRLGELIAQFLETARGREAPRTPSGWTCWRWRAPG